MLADPIGAFAAHRGHARPVGIRNIGPDVVHVLSDGRDVEHDGRAVENANVSDAPTPAILRRAVGSYVGGLGGPDRF